VFLQSDACNYLTGQTIAIDGGHYLAALSTFSALKSFSEDGWKKARDSIKGSVEKEKKQRKN
jgi:hypothetical protein